MAVEEDLARIAEQEKALVFPRFDEAVAFAIGGALKTAAETRGFSLSIDVRTWDRPLFYFAMAGTAPDNAEWARRKSNCVRRFACSSYAVSLRLQRRNGTTLFAADDGIDPMDVAAHGGSFPIRIAGAGIVGAITVSGAPSRDDHGVVVAVIAAQLGLDPAALALGNA